MALGGILDVLWRVEIRLAGAQPDDVAPCRRQLARLVGDGDGGRGFHTGKGIGQKGHGKRSGWGV
jgi:hypothetical protein